MTPTWALSSACDEFARCLYCPSLYRASRRLLRPCVCPVCSTNLEAARKTR